ncbi:MAG: glycoside hydrolase family 127 protein [Clostridia bacterium]|nr:glycoside hydrolase family 127 protein [Clostridia bacterium]
MKSWNFYTTDEIKPAGWLKRQLEIQAAGLGGNLHKVWRDVRDSSWVGGTAEGWERVPYWLDGFIPLAYLLGDKELIGVAKRYVDAIIARQEPDGWICPCTKEERESYDTWAVMIISKALTVYYECSKDERIPEVLYKILKNYYELLKDGKIKLFQWGKFRWFELFISLNFVYSRWREEWLVELAKLLREQGVRYEDFVEDWKHPMNFWRLQTHIVNLTMMLKYEAVSYELLGEEYTDAAETLRTLLDEYNGTPVGLFTGDECLSGVSAIGGTELCSVVEQMYSYEQLFAHTGDSKWAERLEVLAFNALPATFSDDMWAHQYVQMSNQIACKRFPGKSVFGTNNSEAHLFGLEPNFGCCTSNMHQGWPKLTLSAFMHKDGEVINLVPIPTALTTDALTVNLETNYPFENSFVYNLFAKSDVRFTIRIPSFAKNVTLDGTPVPTENVSLNLSAGEHRTVRIAYETVPYIEKRPRSLNTVKCGSLVFSLPVQYETKMYEYEKDGVERKFPYCDYEYLPTSDWSFALASDELTLSYKGVSDVPFSSHAPAVVLKTKVAPINWGFEDGYDSVCAKVPKSTEPTGDAREVELYPYGCAKLRMTELPKII